MKIGNKVRFLKFSKESKNVSKIGGNLKRGGKCIMASGGDGRPWLYLTVAVLCSSLQCFIMNNLPILAGKTFSTFHFIWRMSAQSATIFSGFHVSATGQRLVENFVSRIWSI